MDSLFDEVLKLLVTLILPINYYSNIYSLLAFMLRQFTILNMHQKIGENLQAASSDESFDCYEENVWSCENVQNSSSNISVKKSISVGGAESFTKKDISQNPVNPGPLESDEDSLKNQTGRQYYDNSKDAPKNNFTGNAKCDEDCENYEISNEKPKVCLLCTSSNECDSSCLNSVPSSLSSETPINMWTCVICHYSNVSNSNICDSCDEIKQDISLMVPSRSSSERPINTMWICVVCHYSNLCLSGFCVSCGESFC